MFLSEVERPIYLYTPDMFQRVMYYFSYWTDDSLVCVIESGR